MPRVVKTEKIEGKGKGRKDYSQTTEVAVEPVIRSHQERLGWYSTNSGKLEPGESGASALTIPPSFRGQTMQIRNFRLTFDNNMLLKTYIFWGNLDLALLGYGLNVVAEEFYYKGYEYGTIDVNLEKGIAWDIPEDAEVSQFYPNRYLKHCPMFAFKNVTNKTNSFTHYTNTKGFRSKMVKRG